MKTYQKVLEVLKKGPATTEEVAIELQMSKKLACAHLSFLRQYGMARAWERKLHPHPHAGRPTNVWEAVE